jgi:hypothetical protein
VRRKAKAKVRTTEEKTKEDKEQITALLREILAELRKLNVNLEKKQSIRLDERDFERAKEFENDSDDLEELEDFE